MFQTKNRSSEKEYIDIGASCYSSAEYRDCLIQLSRVGRWLGGDRASFWAFNQLATPPESILDVGCGGGGFTRRLAERYPYAKVHGIDYSSAAIELAKDQLALAPLSNLSFSIPKTLELNAPEKSVDILTTTLVCHHMKDDEIIDFLRRASKVAKKALIINDLHRHPLAIASFALTAPLMFNNRLISHDGLISIKRSFKRVDWISYLKEAGLLSIQWKISWRWAFRWILVITI